LPKISVPLNDERFQVCSFSVASAAGSAGSRQHQGQRVLGGAVDVRRGRVDHQHAGRGGGVDVDVVQPDAGPGDDLQLRRGGDHLGVHRGGRTNQQRVGVGHRGQQFRRSGPSTQRTST
jgi:hypothetical protein